MRTNLLPLLLAAVAPHAAAQRLLHWVIRVSSLEDTVAFTTDILGMKVLRHEENDKPCPLTCNGVFDTPWSKTMVGYGPEDEHYALELTYNYGIDSYDRGEGLQRFVISVAGVPEVLDRARTAGYVTYEADGKSVIIGPDKYEYALQEKRNAEMAEPFGAVVLRAADPAALSAWYADVLGLHSEALPSGAYRLSFPTSSLPDVSFLIEPTPDGKPAKIEQWEGRNALALPETAVRAINARLMIESPHLIIHSMRELEEKLGTLFILIARDIAGYEICLVSIETFDPSVREATNFVGPDWAMRNETRGRVAGLAALDAARKKMLDEWQRRQQGADEEEEEDDEEGDEEDEEEAASAAKTEL